MIAGGEDHLSDLKAGLSQIGGWDGAPVARLADYHPERDGARSSPTRVAVPRPGSGTRGGAPRRPSPPDAQRTPRWRSPRAAWGRTEPRPPRWAPHQPTPARPGASER